MGWHGEAAHTKADLPEPNTKVLDAGANVPQTQCYQIALDAFGDFHADVTDTELSGRTVLI